MSDQELVDKVILAGIYFVSAVCAAYWIAAVLFHVSLTGAHVPFGTLLGLVTGWILRKYWPIS